MNGSRTQRAWSLAPFLLIGPVLLSGCSGLEERIADGLEDVGARAQEAPFSILRHALPPGMSWVACPNGHSEGVMGIIGSTGGALQLSAGHLLQVEPRAVSSETDFVLVEPRSGQIVVNARAVGVNSFAGSGLRLTVSWRDRAGCTVPSGAVVMRVVPGDTAQPLPVVRRGDDFIETRLDSLSTFAIAT